MMPDFGEIFSDGEQMRHLAFTAGATAAEQGKPKSICPYPCDNAFREDWMEGWASED